MKTNIFDYDLPAHRIAQFPAGVCGERSDSKLLCVSNSLAAVEISDWHFYDLPKLIAPGDILVLNDSRVLPARFFANIREVRVEVLLLKSLQASNLVWEALAKPMKKLPIGLQFALSENLTATVVRRSDDLRRIILELEVADRNDPLQIILTEGRVPIPPYIRQGESEDLDEEFYQTVFAGSHTGSVAAPTAGLHFTEAILDELRARGVKIGYLTLDVGASSFLPVREEDLERGELDEERYVIGEDLIKLIDETKRSGSKVVAVGTTVVRALESFARERESGRVPSGNSFVGRSKLFIRPGDSFLLVDSLITNFHQPGTTHLQLVAALVGASSLEKIYRHALENDYRFLSYGDAMFVS